MTPQSGYDVQIHIEPLPALSALGAEWLQLDRIGQHSFFQSWAWIGPWLRISPTLTDKVLMRAVRGRQTIGLAIITLRIGRLHGLLSVRQGWLNASGDVRYDRIAIEHNGFASAEAEPQPLLVALADFISRGGLPVEEIILPGMALPVRPRASSFYVSNHEEIGFQRDLTVQDAEFGVQASLSRNGRQQLHRALRRCESFGPLHLQIARDLAEKRLYFSEMKAFHRTSWQRRGRPDAFDNSHFEPFCLELIEAGGENGSIDLLRLSAGKRPLGVLLNFRRQGVVYSYQSGLDDSDGALRPGYVAHAFAIDHYARSKQRRYDFLAKANRLKESFSTSSYPLSWQTLRRPTFAFRLERLAHFIFRPAARR